MIGSSSAGRADHGVGGGDGIQPGQDVPVADDAGCGWRAVPQGWGAHDGGDGWNRHVVRRSARGPGIGYKQDKFASEKLQSEAPKPMPATRLPPPVTSSASAKSSESTGEEGCDSRRQRAGNGTREDRRPAGVAEAGDRGCHQAERLVARGQGDRRCRQGTGEKRPTSTAARWR